MKKVLISKLYQADTDTWTEVYRLEKSTPSAPKAVDVFNTVLWPEHVDVLSATDIAKHYLGVADVSAGDVLTTVRMLRQAGIITPLYDSKLIKIDGSARRYYAVRNAHKYRTPVDIRREVTRVTTG